MALLRLFDPLLFRHPFVDRFFEDDDEINLFRTVRKSLHNRHLRRAIEDDSEAVHQKNKKSRSSDSGEEEKKDGTEGQETTSSSLSTLHDVFKGHSSLLGSDLVETESEYKIHVDLPGVEASDVDISLVENKHLVIKAERKYVHEEPKDKVHSMERSYGKVQRRFRVPANADVDHVTTVFKNGVLSLSFPKKVKETNVRKLQIVTE
jgi:HSP20 family molecular chaperone IbpA